MSVRCPLCINILDVLMLIDTSQLIYSFKSFKLWLCLYLLLLLFQLLALLSVLLWALLIRVISMIKIVNGNWKIGLGLLNNVWMNGIYRISIIPPQEQMKRLVAAGLNPNSIFGHMSGNVAGPQQSHADTRAVAQAYQLPDFGNAAASTLAAYNNLRLGAAQTNNLEAQATNTAEDTLLKNAQTYKTAAETAKLSGADTEQVLANIRKLDAETKRSTSMLDSDLQFRQAETKKLEADTKFQLDENERRIVANSMGLRESLQRILESRARVATSAVEREKLLADIKYISTNSDIGLLDKALKEKGINPHDNTMFRIVGDSMHSIRESDFFKRVRNWLYGGKGYHEKLSNEK